MLRNKENGGCSTQKYQPKWGGVADPFYQDTTKRNTTRLGGMRHQRDKVKDRLEDKKNALGFRKKSEKGHFKRGV